MNRVKISPYQLMVIVLLFTIGTSLLVIPSSLAYFAKQDGWIAAAVGGMTGLLIVWLFIAVGNLDPRLTLVQLNDKVFGKWIGKLISLLLVSSLIVAAPPAVLYYLSDFMVTQIIPATPIQSINIVYAVIAVIGVRLGIEVMARSAEILFPWVLLLFIVMVFCILPQTKLEYAQPVLETGVKQLWPAILTFLSIAIFPSITLLMIYPPSLNRPKAAQKAFYTGYVLGCLMMILIVVLCILALGPDLTERSLYPSYILARKISVGKFFQRIEAIMAFMWFISLYFRLTIFLYAIAIGIAQIFNLRDYRPLVIPLGLLTIALSTIIYPNTIYATEWDTYTYIPYTFSIGFVYPLLLLGAASIRKMVGNAK
nr:endospore germination permease [Paenibacillus sp. MSJ-34]